MLQLMLMLSEISEKSHEEDPMTLEDENLVRPCMSLKTFQLKKARKTRSAMVGVLTMLLRKFTYMFQLIYEMPP